MTAPASIVTPQVLADLRAFCEAFQRRYALQPPEFSHPQSWYGAKDIYDTYSAGIRRADWFQSLITGASSADLAALDSLALRRDIDGDGYQFCMIRCMQFAILEIALARDQAGQTVSAAIPRYFRDLGWGVPPTWTCEIQADNEAFLARQDAALAATPTQIAE